MSDEVTHGAAARNPKVEVVYSNGCPVCHGSLWSQEDLDCNALPCPACNGGDWEGQLLDSLKDGIAVGEKHSAAENKALRSALSELVDAITPLTDSDEVMIPALHVADFFVVLNALDTAKSLLDGGKE